MRRFFYTMAVLGTLVGCATGEIGTPCFGAPTEEGHCVEGAVCARERSSTVEHPDLGNADGSFCRQLCDVISDCEEGYDCLVVGGSMYRACQPRD